MQWISLKNACELLKVSRPTLNHYRQTYRLSEAKFGGKICLSKIEIIEKIILRHHQIQHYFSFTVFSEFNVRQIQPFLGVYDLRMLKGIDAYGVMALLCSIHSYLKEEEKNSVSLLLDGSPLCHYLESIGFFTEVERAHKDRVFCNYPALKKHPQNKPNIILPLHLIGYRGAEKKIIDELYNPLLKQGFSENYCGHIGWIMGELCDNAHMHSAGPCTLIIEGLASSAAARSLCIAMGDTGIGIPASLKKNPKYCLMKDRILLPLAFRSEVSRMEVEPKRGKGLSDVIAISKGNQSWLRVESGDQAMRFDFRDHSEKIDFVPPTSHALGTRFCLVLSDGEFKPVSRIEINEMLRIFIEGI